MGNASALCHIRAGSIALQCFQYGVWRKYCMVSLLDHQRLCWNSSEKLWVFLALGSCHSLAFLVTLAVPRLRVLCACDCFQRGWVCILLGLAKQNLSYPLPSTFYLVPIPVKIL